MPMPDSLRGLSTLVREKPGIVKWTQELSHLPSVKKMLEDLRKGLTSSRPLNEIRPLNRIGIPMVVGRPIEWEQLRERFLFPLVAVTQFMDKRVRRIWP